MFIHETHPDHSHRYNSAVRGRMGCNVCDIIFYSKPSALMHHSTIQKYKRLEDTIKRQAEIIAKRNEQISWLRKRTYDVNLMFYLMLQFRELDEKWFHGSLNYNGKRMEVIDFFILLHMHARDTFKEHEVNEIVASIPAYLGKPKKVANALQRLKGMGIAGTYVVLRQRSWFIKPDGKWFLLQRTQDIRRIITEGLKLQYKATRRVAGKRGRI